VELRVSMAITLLLITRQTLQPALIADPAVFAGGWWPYGGGQDHLMVMCTVM